MVNNRFIVLCFFLSLQSLLHSDTPAPHIITFFFKPELHRIGANSSTNGSNSSAHALPNSMQHAQLAQSPSAELVQGIWVVLNKGLVTFSDANGEVIFPRQQISEVVTVVVTNGIVPIFLSASTVYHNQLRENAPAAFYTYTRNHNQKTGKSTWIVQRIHPPAQNRIPDDAIVIIAKPEQIDIIEGVSETGDSANFILPHMYVKEKVTTPINVLSLLKYNKFFAPVYKSFAYAPGRYATLIANSL